MKVFDKIQAVITSTQQNGHALNNIKNIESLTKAKEEIESMLYLKTPKEKESLAYFKAKPKEEIKW